MKNYDSNPDYDMDTDADHDRTTRWPYNAAARAAAKASDFIEIFMEWNYDPANPEKPPRRMMVRKSAILAVHYFDMPSRYRNVSFMAGGKRYGGEGRVEELWDLTETQVDGKSLFVDGHRAGPTRKFYVSLRKSAILAVEKGEAVWSVWYAVGGVGEVDGEFDEREDCEDRVLESLKVDPDVGQGVLDDVLAAQPERES